MDEVTGWLFDVYSHTESGVVLWVIADSGERLQLRMELPMVMYLAGDFKLLRAAWVFLKGRAGLARVRRRDLFMGERDVLQVTSANHGDLIQELQNQFPSLDYYDTDIPISLRFIALTGVHLLGRCRIRLSRERVQAIEPLDSPWELSPEPIPVQVMETWFLADLPALRRRRRPARPSVAAWCAARRAPLEAFVRPLA